MNLVKLQSYRDKSRTLSQKIVEYVIYFSLLYVSPVVPLELKTENPLRNLPLGGTESLFPFKTFVGSKENNLTDFALAHRSGRVKRDSMFYFPAGSSLTFQFRLITPVYSDSSITITSDLRLEVKFKLPNRPSSRRRRRRSITDDRADLYRTIMTLIDESGFDGRECLQRAVCEAAQAPLLEYGLLGEVLGILLTPGHDGGAVTTAFADRFSGGSKSMEKLYSNFSHSGRDEDNFISSPQWKKPLKWRKKPFENFKSRFEDINQAGNSSFNRQRRDALVSNYFDMSDFVQAEEYGRYDGSCWIAFPNCAVSIREVLFDALSALSKNNYLLVHDEL